jgi:hypothetical protein
MTHPHGLRARARRGTILAVLMLSGGLCQVDAAQAGQRLGDRFGLRFGIWPQPSAHGTLNSVPIQPEEIEGLYDAVVDEPSHVAPYLELFGMFHLSKIWWVEGSVGWSRRTDVQVQGVKRDGTAQILFGEGNVDFIPVFLGVRAVHHYGSSPRPHNVYARGGPSLVFATESGAVIYPNVLSLYREGTEGALGFLVAVGGEYYVLDRFAATIDLQYRYAQFNYAEHAHLDQSAFWVGVGVTLNTR